MASERLNYVHGKQLNEYFHLGISFELEIIKSSKVNSFLKSYSVFLKIMH